MKLIYFVDDLVIGGVEKVLFTICSHINPEKYDISLVVLFSPGDLDKEFLTLDIPVHFLHLQDCGYLKGLWKIKKILKKEKADIVHCFRDISRSLVPRIASKTGVPKIIMRWDNPSKPESWKVRLLENIQKKFATNFDACSHVVASSVSERLNLKNCSISHNGIYLNGQKTFPVNFADSALTICSIGNFKNEKNHLDQVKAMELLIQNGIQVELIMIGSGATEQLIKGEITRKILGPKIRLIGKKNDILSELRKAQLFICTSLYEGFGIAILEAMSVGIPCVLYDIPAFREISGDSDCFYFTSENTPESLSQTIQNILQNRKELSQKAKLAYQRLKDKFTCKHMLENLDKLYLDS